MGAAEGISGWSNGNRGIWGSGVGADDGGVGSVGGAGGLGLESGGEAWGDFAGGFVAAFGAEDGGGDVGAEGVEVGGGEDGVTSGGGDGGVAMEEGGGDGFSRVSISTFIPARQWPGTPQMKNLLPDVKRVIAVLPPVCFSMGLLAEQELKSGSLTSSTSWFDEYSKTVED